MPLTHDASVLRDTVSLVTGGASGGEVVVLAGSEPPRPG